MHFPNRYQLRNIHINYSECTDTCKIIYHFNLSLDMMYLLIKLLLGHRAIDKSWIPCRNKQVLRNAFSYRANNSIAILKIDHVMIKGIIIT